LCYSLALSCGGKHGKMPKLRNRALDRKLRRGHGQCVDGEKLEGRQILLPFLWLDFERGD